MASRRARGRLILFLALLLTLPSVAAHAAEISTNCAGLQAALDAANDGDVITITDATCTGSSFTMATGVEITLQGAPGTGTILDGTGAPTRLLSGFDVGSSTLRNLVFRDSVISENGGAVMITGTVSPHFDQVRFSENAGSDGGGLYVSSTANAGTVLIANSLFDGNSADDSGGGLAINTLQAPSVDVVIQATTFAGNSSLEWGGGASTFTHDLTLENNVFNDNTAGGKGGGAYLIVDQAEATLTNNTFVSNQIDPEPGLAADGFNGGGLYLGGSGGSDITQRRNVFDANEISTGAPPVIGGYGGAGEYIVRANLNGSSDAVEIFLDRERFINNVANDPGPPIGVRGGGLGATTVHIEAWNTVAAGNSVLGGVSRGSGMYVGNGTSLLMINSTVAGNVAVSGTAGVGGDSDDTLNVQNSIVADNTGTTPDISGFGTVNAQFTDSCAGVGFAGGPLPGPGNICADPLLANPGPGVADVHQTAASPTRDAGSNALVPPAMTTDYEGEDRIMDSNADGVAVVDMGADELLQPLIVQPQPQPPAQPPLQQAAAARGRIPATGPEDLLPQSFAAFSYVLLGILLLRVTTPKWQAAWRATSYAARHSTRSRRKYVAKHRRRRRTN